MDKGKGDTATCLLALFLAAFFIYGEIMSKKKTKELIKYNEGYKAKPYRDTVGVLTWGYGHNLNVSISPDNLAEIIKHGGNKETAEAVFEEDYERAYKTFVHFCPVPIKSLSAVRKAALIDLSFNLGYRLNHFRKFKAAIASENWDLAAKELIDSKWYRQVKSRGPRIVQMIRENQWPEVIERSDDA